MGNQSQDVGNKSKSQTGTSPNQKPIPQSGQGGGRNQGRDGQQGQGDKSGSSTPSRPD
jgi:hypothetical protein